MTSWPGPPVGQRSAAQPTYHNFLTHTVVAPPSPTTLWMKTPSIEGEGLHEWTGEEKGRKEERDWRKDGEEEGGGQEGGRMKQDGNESHLWPRSLRSTFHSGHALLCVSVCVWWHVRVVIAPTANQTHFKQLNGFGSTAMTERAGGPERWGSTSASLAQKPNLNKILNKRRNITAPGRLLCLLLSAEKIITWVIIYKEPSVNGRDCKKKKNHRWHKHRIHYNMLPFEKHHMINPHMMRYNTLSDVKSWG